MTKNTYYRVLGVVIGVIISLLVVAIMTGPLVNDAATFAEAGSEVVTNVDGPWYTVGAMPVFLVSGIIFVLASVTQYLIQSGIIVGRKDD